MKTSPSARGASKKRARSSSLTSLLVAAEPLLVALLALRFDPSESVTGIRLAGLFIGMMGVVALLGLDVGGDRFKLVGALLVLLAAAGYATGALLVKRPVFAGIPSLGVVAAECAAASVVLTPLALVHLPRGVALASLAMMRLICTAAAWLTFLLRRRGRRQPRHGVHIRQPCHRSRARHRGAR